MHNTMETVNDLSPNSIEKQNQEASALPPNSSLPTKTKSSNSLIIWIVIIFICIGSAIGLNFIKNINSPSSSLQTQQNTNEKGVLRVGETIDEDGLAADTKEFQPFIDYLVANLHQYGYTKGEFVGAHSVAEMTELMREGKIDLAIDSAFPVYIVDNLTGAVPIADRWKGGVGVYHSAVFVKQNSPIKTVDDLKGKLLAFDSETSTVGYFLPKAELIKQGYTLTKKSKPTDACAQNEICYIFVHGNVYDSVAQGIVSAGAESELEINNHFGSKIADYRIISRSPDILRFLVAVRGNVKPQLRESIKSVLFEMDKSSKGKIILSSFAETAKFTPVTSTDSAYGEIKNLTALVEQEIITQ